SRPPASPDHHAPRGENLGDPKPDATAFGGPPSSAVGTPRASPSVSATGPPDLTRIGRGVTPGTDLADFDPRRGFHRARPGVESGHGDPANQPKRRHVIRAPAR